MDPAGAGWDTTRGAASCSWPPVPTRIPSRPPPASSHSSVLMCGSTPTICSTRMLDLTTSKLFLRLPTGMMLLPALPQPEESKQQKQQQQQQQQQQQNLGT